MKSLPNELSVVSVIEYSTQGSPIANFYLQLQYEDGKVLKMAKFTDESAASEFAKFIKEMPVSQITISAADLF